MEKRSINWVCQWKLPNLAENPKDDYRMEFCLANGSSSLLQLHLRRNCLKSFWGKHISFTLHIKFKNVDEILKNSTLQVKCTVKDNELKLSHRFPMYINVHILSGECVFLNVIFLHEYIKLQKAGEIFLICEIKDSSILQFETGKAHNLQECLQPLSFDSYLDNEHLSDVTLYIGEKRIRAHKLILSAKSAVFAKMFSHKTKENLTNEVNIEFGFDVFWKVLVYLYTGNLDTYSKIPVFEIFKAADYYLINCLTRFCEQYLKNNLINLEFTEVLKFADDNRLVELKEYCILLFVKNRSQFINWDDSKLERLTSHPHLLCKLLTVVLPK